MFQGYIIGYFKMMNKTIKHATTCWMTKNVTTYQRQKHEKSKENK